jgi:hypothetical protein
LAKSQASAPTKRSRLDFGVCIMHYFDSLRSVRVAGRASDATSGHIVRWIAHTPTKATPRESDVLAHHSAHLLSVPTTHSQPRAIVQDDFILSTR